MKPSRVISRDFDSQLEILAHHARKAPDRVVYSFLDEDTTYGELWHSIEAFAGGLLERGLSRGDRVVMAQPNGPGFFTAFYGAQRAGAIAVPVAAGPVSAGHSSVRSAGQEISGGISSMTVTTASSQTCGPCASWQHSSTRWSPGGNGPGG